MKRTASVVIRWGEHVLLVILLIIVLGSVVPFSKVSGGAGNLMVSSEVTADGADVSEEVTNLLPDLALIYRTAVTYPLEKAGAEISDPSLRAFYLGFLETTGLAP